MAFVRRNRCLRYTVVEAQLSKEGSIRGLRRKTRLASRIVL